jgi:hypothetical protein
MTERFIGYVEVETAKALLFQDHFWHEPDWMPKSQVEVMRDIESNEVVLEASNWICKQKGASEFEEVLAKEKPDE